MITNLMELTPDRELTLKQTEDVQKEIGMELTPDRELTLHSPLFWWLKLLMELTPDRELTLPICLLLCLLQRWNLLPTGN